MKKIGVLTGGADCPGLNAVIRAIVRKAMHQGYVVNGIKNGWQGLIDNDSRVLDLRITANILDRGGTILGTSRMGSPLSSENTEKIKDNFSRSGLDAVIAVGGENTLKIALDLYKEIALPVIGIPKSIENALSGTDYAFGFDTAVNIATECIDRLHTTAESHHRIMVIEVMGQYTGWISLQAGIAGGADIILVPEYNANIENICAALSSRHKRGKNFSIIVISEGTKVTGLIGDPVKGEKKIISNTGVNIGEIIASLIREKTGYDTKVSVLGHIQRGGSPSAYDRLLATRFGIKAVDLIEEKNFGKMVSLRDNKIKSVDISVAVKKRKTIDRDLYDIAQLFAQ